MSTYIKYPFAIKKFTNEIVDINEVDNGLKCNCYCIECGKELQAINGEENKMIPHFRHNPGSECSGNYETYIHKVTKEIFKKFDFIELPEIRFKKLYNEYWSQSNEFEKAVESIYINHNVPSQFRDTFKFDFVLQEAQNLKFDNCSIEKTFQTVLGDIRVDIVISTKDSMMFVEPYFSNIISPNKHQKLKEQDCSTISISLMPFQMIKNNRFSLIEFTGYLISENSKDWVLIRKKKVKHLQRKFLKKFEKEIIKEKEIFADYIDIQKQMSKDYKEKLKLEKKISDLRKEVYTFIEKSDNDLSKQETLIKEYYVRMKQ